jgi:Porin PorA
MRRIVGLVLAGLGTCLIVFAVLMPAYVSSRVLKFPLNEYETATLTASNVSYFSPTKLTELTGVNMEATYTLKGNAAAGSSSTAVWNEFTYVYDETNKLPFQTLTRTFAFNRRNAQLIDCCGANVNGDSSIRQTGYAGYVLPIGTQQHTYDVFDANLNKPVPFTYAGPGTVDGIKTYKFVENVAATKNGSQTLPGSLVGQSQATVTLPQYYQMRLTYWIDPDTGVLLNVTEDEKLTLEDSTGAQALLLLDANLAATQPSINRVVAQDNSGRSKMSLVSTTLPLVTGIVGVILLIVGIILARRPREDAEAAPSATSPELAPVRPEAARSQEAAPQVAQASIVPGLDDQPHEATIESPAVPAEAAQAEATAAEPSHAAAADTAEAETPQAEAPQVEAVTAEAPQADAPKADAPEAEAVAAAGVAAAGAAAVAAASKAKTSKARAAKAKAAQAKAAPADAPQAEAPPAEASAPQSEAPAPQPPVEAPAAEAPPAEAPPAEAPPEAAAAETPTAASETLPTPVEASTAEMPATPGESGEGAQTQETPAAADAVDANTADEAATTRHRRRARHRR